MKKIIFILSAFVILLSASCKKEYICVCTDKHTGARSEGEHFKAGPLVKKSAEESCEAHNEVYSADLEDCHLE